MLLFVMLCRYEGHPATTRGLAQPIASSRDQRSSRYVWENPEK